MSKLTEAGSSHMQFLSETLDDDAVTKLVSEQLTSTSLQASRPIESHTAESKRLGISRFLAKDKRCIMASATIVVQRVCANSLLDATCTKVKSLGGVSQTYFERHRGDETPFSRVSATDTIFDDDAKVLEDVAAEVVAVTEPCVAIAPNAEKSNVIQAQSVTANLKVYSTDCEVAGLYILEDSELLISFKILQPLARLDRCTGQNYARLHTKQSDLLKVSERFIRKQRLHTSDGDAAQDLAERKISKDNKRDPKYSVSTLRAQCQVHRVYHCITACLALFSNFITGQIKLALSLRGPGHFTKFKAIVWKWILQNCDYRWEDPKVGPGPAADKHRTEIYSTFFPTCRGRCQRKNRLKYWIIRKLANGDIRVAGKFIHHCGEGCCKSFKDYLRKMKWLVAVVAGKMCKIFPRSRWAGMDESVDWVGILTNVHNILPETYALWYQHVTGRKLSSANASPLPAGPVEFAAIVDDSDLGLIPDLEGDVGDDAAAPDGADAEPEPAVPSATKSASEPLDPNDPKQKEKDRNIAMRFVRTPSLSSTSFGIRKIMTPAFNLMHSSLDQGGSRWEKLQ